VLAQRLAADHLLALWDTDGASGAVPASRTDLPERVSREPAVSAIASLADWRLVLEAG
jgi:hypothetical protein